MLIGKSFMVPALVFLLCAACHNQSREREAAGGATTQKAEPVGAERPSLVLITLDTTRPDYLGCYGAVDARTPALDGLAAGGMRYAVALSSTPLTLPSHTSILTGLDPPEHGVRGNGTAALGPDVPTLATVLSGRGYVTGAFVASRVLDRRFGLNRGFDVYDDHMAAESVGEYGYPERNATAVTDAAVSWLKALSGEKPYFLWLHYYDPHSPYQPPEPGTSREENYAGEIAFVDTQIQRLLAYLPAEGKRVIAVAGDHGESLGEHGERTHGIFLYGSTLRVPLILSGTGVPVGRVETSVVGLNRLSATLLNLLGLGDWAEPFGRPLPGFPFSGSTDPDPIYSEARLPARAYGWRPLKAITDREWRLIVAPRAELYHLGEDPAESNNRIDVDRDQAFRLKQMLENYESRMRTHEALIPEADPQLAADLRSLGYLGGASGERGDEIDPKEGILLLKDFEQAKELMEQGQFAQAEQILDALTQRNPHNIPFLTQLGRARLALGQHEIALNTYRQAVELNPGLDFLHTNLAEALAGLGRKGEARQEFRLALKLNPRMASAWLSLAEMAAGEGKRQEELEILREAVGHETRSAGILTRLAQIEMGAGRFADAETHLRSATALMPALSVAWLLWGHLCESQNRLEDAAEYYRRAADSNPNAAGPHLRLGRLFLRMGNTKLGRAHLQRAANLEPNSREGREAYNLLRGQR